MKEEEQGAGSRMDDSPIEQVRLTVPPTDDPTLHVLTLRTWILGIPILILQTVLLRLDAFRQNQVFISSACMNILSLIGGRLLAKLLPNKVVKIPWTRRCAFSLNPGPFNVKEHIAVAMLMSSATSAPGFESVSVAKIFYHKTVHPLPAFLLVLSSQLIGFGLVGIFFNFFVESAYMWWPSVLVDVSFYRALHEVEKRPKGKLSRYQFFLLVSIASFAYGIIPTYLFPSITALSFVCWIWKDSVIAQQLGSGKHGLGIGSFALDWMTITSFTGNPLAMPASALFNIMAGFVLLLYVLLPIFYYGINAYDSRRFPIVSGTGLFDYDGREYNVSRIIDANTLTLDQEAYYKYSKVYLSIYLTLIYGFSLATYTSSLSYTILFYGRSTWKQLKKSYTSSGDDQDVHTRLMNQNYKPVPRWWFYSVTLVMIGFAILVCEAFGDQIQLRYWGVILACGLALIFLFPGCVLSATVSYRLQIDLLLKILIGYVQPGKPIANLAFQNYGFLAYNVAISLLGAFKLCHYMKVPLRIVFWLKLVCTTVACFIDFALGWWLIHSIENICQPNLLPRGSPWTCPAERGAFATGVTWGAIGPIRMFYPHGTYSMVYIFFLIGFFAPFLTWILSLKYPHKNWISFVYWPLIFGAANFMPYAMPVNMWSYLIVGLVFNYFVFRRYKDWWVRHNYVLSAGLDLGVAFLTIFLTVCLQFQGIYGIKWWGQDLDDHCPLARCPTAAGVVVDGCPVIN